MTSSEPVIITCTYGGRQGAKGDAGSDGTAADTGYWLTGTTYAAGDRCYHDKAGYGQSVYRCKTGQGHISGATTEPEVGASWEDKWELFAEGGQDGTVVGEGVSGGQTIIGGTGSGEDLTLGSTAHATKGNIIVQDPLAFNEQLGDLISWYGNQIGVGAGAYCTGIEANTLYWRSNNYFRWYLGCLSDAGTSDTMQLSAAGLYVVGGITRTGPGKQSILRKTASYTITDADPDIVVIGAITALDHTTITLPTAADNVGRIITVVIDGDPGAKNVIVDGEGAETINGAATKTNSVIYSYLTMLCNGVGWDIISSAGTWS